MATVTLTLNTSLRPWARAALWIGKRSPRLLGLIVLALGEERFTDLVVRYGVRVTAA